MKKKKETKIILISFVAFFIIVFYIVILLMIEKEEKRECLVWKNEAEEIVWQKKAEKIEGYFIFSWQKEQCDNLGIYINAPVKYKRASEAKRKEVRNEVDGR